MHVESERPVEGGFMDIFITIEMPGGSNFGIILELKYARTGFIDEMPDYFSTTSSPNPQVSPKNYLSWHPVLNKKAKKVDKMTNDELLAIKVTEKFTDVEGVFTIKEKQQTATTQLNRYMKALPDDSKGYPFTHPCYGFVIIGISRQILCSYIGSSNTGAPTSTTGGYNTSHRDTTVSTSSSSSSSISSGSSTTSNRSTSVIGNISKKKDAENNDYDMGEANNTPPRKSKKKEDKSPISIALKEKDNGDTEKNNKQKQDYYAVAIGRVMSTFTNTNTNTNSN